MNFTLNGHTVSVVRSSHGFVDGIAVSVDGIVVGFRPTMAAALTLATHASADHDPMNVPGYREHVHAGRIDPDWPIGRTCR